jgi:hypothetical protein
LIGYNIFSDKSIKENGTDELSRIIYHTSILLTIIKQIKSEIHGSIFKIIEYWGLDEYFSSMLPLAEKNFIREDKKILWSEILDNFNSLPLNDLGKQRKICWSESGIEWELNFSNDYNTVPIAEQFAAILQILLCDLSNADLFLMKTKVSINIAVDSEFKYEISHVPSNRTREWNIKFPYYKEISKANFDDIQTFCVTSITEIFFEVSLKPDDELLNLLKESFKKGLSLKVFIAQPYEIIFRKFITKEGFNKIPKDKFEPPISPKPFIISSHPLLCWKGDLAKTYSEDKANEFLQNRYKYIPQSIKYTLPNLLAWSEFRETVTKLKANGWKDWHILNSVAGITLNFRMKQIKSLRNNPENMRKYMLEQMSKNEPKDAIKVPHSYFTEESIVIQHNTNMMSTLKVLGLECRQLTPDFDAINHFLRYRFNYWKDDIDHEDLFTF